MLLFISCLVSALIVCTNGQYGQPIVYGNGQFSYECRQTDVDVVSLPNNLEYEVTAGKSFSYYCEFFVDTRNCRHNRQSSGCDGIEIVWSLPEKLTQLERNKGVTRKSENTVIEKMDGYDIYRSTLNLNSVGLVHEGQYSWKFNLRFEMRTVMEGSFKVTTIDMLQLDEPCKYDDMCNSHKCLQGICGEEVPKPFPWIIVTVVVIIVILLAAVITLAILYVRNKHVKYMNKDIILR